ncbi:MAG TPA: hypothetical protein VGB14_16265 [Acidimicrobiales bacterium]|jgi:hypothetical protein
MASSQSRPDLRMLIEPALAPWLDRPVSVGDMTTDVVSALIDGGAVADDETIDLRDMPGNPATAPEERQP